MRDAGFEWGGAAPGLGRARPRRLSRYLVRCAPPASRGPREAPPRETTPRRAIPKPSQRKLPRRNKRLNASTHVDGGARERSSGGSADRTSGALRISVSRAPSNTGLRATGRRRGKPCRPSQGSRGRCFRRPRSCSASRRCRQANGSPRAQATPTRGRPTLQRRGRARPWTCGLPRRRRKLRGRLPVQHEVNSHCRPVRREKSSVYCAGREPVLADRPTSREDGSQRSAHVNGAIEARTTGS